MNQNVWKTAESKVEKYFYKLLNNSNFGNDCRNNIGNCSLELIYDGLEEISYIKQFADIFTDPKLKEFFLWTFLENKLKMSLTRKSTIKLIHFIMI